MSQMNQELLTAITFIADEKKIPRDAVVDALKNAIIKSYMREFPEEVINADINIDQKILHVYQILNIVDDYEDLNDYCEISLDDAKAFYAKNKIQKEAVVGEQLHKNIELNKLPKKIVDRIMQTFRQLILMQSNNVIYQRWKDRVGTIIYAEVEKNDNHGVVVNLENGEFGYLGRKDIIPNENLMPGQKYRFLVKEVLQSSSGWPILLTRTNEEFVLGLLKEEIPEINEGLIEIHAIKRVPGFKTKVCVSSHQIGLEPCGTIIGPQGSRIAGVRRELNYELVEAVFYSDDFETFLINLCYPALIYGYKVVSEATEDHKKQVIIVVPSDQMALLIGKFGANIRLISKILNIDADVKTPQEAKIEDLQYNRVEIKTQRQRTFERILESNKAGHDLDMNQFNKPNPIDLNTLKDKDNTIVAQSEPNTQIKVKKTTSAKKILNSSNAVNLLDQIDNFQFELPKEDNENVNSNINNNHVENEKSVEIVTKKTTTNKKSLIEKLMANEETRQLSGNASDLEAKLENEKIFKEANKKKKSVKKSRNKAKVEPAKFTSILEEFKNKNNEELLKELENENQDRDYEELLDNYEDQDEE